jgi:hypothetical protein
MRIWYDTEFLEDGHTIDLISIGMVAEDGRQYYAVNADADWDRIADSDWLCENVVPSLPLMPCGTLPDLITKMGPASGKRWAFAIDRYNSDVRPRWLIANEVRDFILATPDPSLWAWYGAYDHVALCQLWGTMVSLPKGVPMWTNDLKQECERLGNPKVPQQAEGEHNALADARRNWVIDEFLAGLAAKA